MLLSEADLRSRLITGAGRCDACAAAAAVALASCTAANEWSTKLHASRCVVYVAPAYLDDDITHVVDSGHRATLSDQQPTKKASSVASSYAHVKRGFQPVRNARNATSKHASQECFGPCVACVRLGTGLNTVGNKSFAAAGLRM